MMKQKMCSVIVLSAIFLAACGGGGGGGTGGTGGSGGSGGSTTPSPSPSSSGTSYPATGSGDTAYLFYVGGISAVDPADPASPVTVESGDIVTDDYGVMDSAAVMIQAGSYDNTTKILSNVHSHAVIYAKTDGHFYKVSAQKGGSLTPTQVSSESEADQLCLFSVRNGSEMYALAAYQDFANPNNAQVVYSLPGSDGECLTKDDDWKMVRLNMGASDAPVPAMIPVAVLRDTNTGAISGWLVNEPDLTDTLLYDSGDLKRCDAAFSACSASLKYVYTTPTVLLGLGMNRYLLEDVGLYDGVSNTLSSLLIHSDTLAADDSDIYYESQVVGFPANSSSIFRAPIDGSTPPVEVVNETVDLRYTQQLDLTDTRVVYAVNGTDSNGAQLRAVNKTGVGDPVILASTDVALSGVRFNIVGKRIFYTFFSDVTGFLGYNVIAAGIVNDDGSGKTETAKAEWAGAVFADSVDLSKSSATGYSSDPGQAIFVEGYEAMGSGQGFAGATVKSFDTATGSEIATLGVVPDTSAVHVLYCSGLGTGNNALCGDGGRVFFINAATADSFQQVDDGSLNNKFPIF